MSFKPNPKPPGHPPLDVAGMRFGRWTALRRAGQAPRTLATLWLCRCDCGAENLVRLGGLRGGTSRSCGCLRREMRAADCMMRPRLGGKFVTA